MSRALLALALLILVGCDSNPPAKNPNADPCNPDPPLRCQAEPDCAPYRCHLSQCERTCTNNTGCVSGFACVGGKCLKPGSCGACSGDYDCPPGKKCNLQAATCG